MLTAGVTGALAVVGIRARAGSRVARVIPPVGHVLGGGLIGFISLAFFPAAPVLAAIGGMLAARAVQSSRWTDAALLATGFGTSWTVLFGYRLINDALDPAVSSSRDLAPWFAAGAIVLVGGLVWLMWLVARPERVSPRG